MSSPLALKRHTMTEDQFLHVYREHGGELFAFVARRASSERALVEDVVQETWLRAVSSWTADGMPAAPPSWLHTVARNLLYNHFRNTPPEVTSPLDLEACLVAPGEEAEDPEALRLLAFGLAHLRPAQAALLEAFHLDGKPVGAIAAEVGLSERAVEGRLHRARRALRSRMAPLMKTEGGPS